MNHTADAGERTAPLDAVPDWLDNAPLMQAWRRFVASDPAPFTIPGHKRRADRLHPDLGQLLDPDVPLYGGLDTVKLTSGVLREAERPGCRPLGSRRVPVLDGGIHARQSGPVPDRRAARGRCAGRAQRPPQRPVRARAGGAAAGLDRGHDRPGNRCSARSRPSDGSRALAMHPEAVALFCTEPSYQGTLSDLAALADAAHDQGIPVAGGPGVGSAPGLRAGIPRTRLPGRRRRHGHQRAQDAARLQPGVARTGENRADRFGSAGAGVRGDAHHQPVRRDPGEHRRLAGDPGQPRRSFRPRGDDPPGR